MNQTLAILIFLVMATAGCKTKPPEQISSNSNAEMLSQERVWTEAFKNRDKEALAHILADKFVFTDETGQVYNKDQYIGAVMGVIKVESYTVDKATALVHGDTGIVTGRWTGKLSVDGKDASGDFRFTDVFIHRGGRWQVIASQDTRVPGSMPNP